MSMKRFSRQTKRLGLHAKGFNKIGKQVFSATMRIPMAFIRRIEASSAVEFKIKILYGRAKTISGRIEEIVNELSGKKKEVVYWLKIFLSKSELDDMERYWSFV